MYCLHFILSLSVPPSWNMLCGFPAICNLHCPWAWLGPQKQGPVPRGACHMDTDHLAPGFTAVPSRKTWQDTQ